MKINPRKHGRRLKRRRQAEQDRDAAIDALFNENDALDMPEESELDETAEAVAARDRLAGARETAVADEVWECDDWQPNRAANCAVLDRPVAKRTMKSEPEPKTMPIRRWNPSRGRQIPKTRPRRNWLGKAVLSLSVLLAGLVGFGGSGKVGPADSSSPSLSVSAIPATPSRPRTKNIEEVHVAERLAGRNPELGDVERTWEEPDPATWRKLELLAPKTDGSHADVTLLRPLSWLTEHDARVSGTVPISVPECGIEGHAIILSIGPCPPIQPGDGPVVTGTFHHHAAKTIDVHVEGISEPIGCTPNHPFWSEDRQTFVRADLLEPGEKLRTFAGTSVVTKIAPRPDPEPVFNLEVQGEHVYLVTAGGVLVHNGHPCMTMVPKGAGETLTHRNGIYETITQQGISGTTRAANRASANRALLQAIDSNPQFARQLGEILGVDDVAAHMRSGRSGLRNPPGTEWHHPIDNPEEMQLLRRQVHRHPKLRNILHPDNIGGFGTHFGD